LRVQTSLEGQKFAKNHLLGRRVSGAFWLAISTFEDGATLGGSVFAHLFSDLQATSASKKTTLAECTASLVTEALNAEEDKDV
jgi:hypothetical protein